MSAATGTDYAALHVPPPSLGHEFGIMFGFLAIMALSMLLYGLAWQQGNKRSAIKERERIAALRASGWLKEKIPEAEEDRREYVGATAASAPPPLTTAGDGRKDEGITEIKL